MARKNDKKNIKGWFWKFPEGPEKGPSDIQIIREKVLAGEITAQTEVSQDGENWSPAVFSPDFGFDCVVLQVGESLNVLGPFAREYMDQQETDSEIPADGILFFRGGLVSETVSGGGVVGETGSALVEKVMAAERRLREGLKEKRAAEASLAAKDLEFDAERQRLNSTISGLKAEKMKVESELEGLRAEVALSDADKDRESALEAKLVDAENALVRVSKEVEQLEVRLTDMGNQLSKHQTRCVELEGELAGKDDTVAALERRVSEFEAQVAKLNDKLKIAEDAQAASHESAVWLRDRVIDLAKQVETQFAASAASNQVLTKGQDESDVIEEVEAEVIGDPSPAYSMQKRTPASRSGEPRKAKLSAIESQLQREISTLSVSKAESVASGHGGFANVFKRRK